MPLPGNVLLQYNDYGLSSPGHRDTYVTAGRIYMCTVSRESFSFSFPEPDHLYAFHAYRYTIEVYLRITDAARRAFKQRNNDNNTHYIGA